jgi:poly-gamma-glutamate capsule biosynthesis protein CapA/YwtB (metallophosphatase superfamily)
MAKRVFGRRRGSFARGIFFIALLALMAGGAALGLRAFGGREQAPTPVPAGENHPAAATPTPTPAPRSLRLCAVGDVMVHQRQLNAAKQQDGTYDFSNYFTEVTPYLRTADLTFANLETTLLGRQYRGYPHFCAPDSILDAMKSAGFNVVTTSNNHSFDTGWEGLARTIDVVRSYGFHQTGTYKSAEDYQTPLIIDANGVKVGVIAYTHGVNGRERVVSGEQLSFCIRFIRNADYARDIKALRDAGAEVVVAVMHWGSEYARTPSSAIRAEAQKLAQAGVDVIFGSHPHVVQPIEIIETVRDDGSTARCAVAFSMGNFISNQRDRYTDCGIILNLTLTEDAQGRFHVEQMGFVPTYVNRKTNYTDYRVLPVAEYIGDETRLDKLDSYNQGRVRRAYNDLTQHLEAAPAALITAPTP